MSYDPIAADLQRELAGAKADLVEEKRLAAALANMIVTRDKRIEELGAEVRRITEHRDRLLAEKEVAWGVVLEADDVVLVRADRALLAAIEGAAGAWSTPLHVRIVEQENGMHAMHFKHAETSPPAAATDAPALNHLSTTEEGGE